MGGDRRRGARGVGKRKEAAGRRRPGCARRAGGQAASSARPRGARKRCVCFLSEDDPSTKYAPPRSWHDLRRSGPFLWGQPGLSSRVLTREGRVKEAAVTDGREGPSARVKRRCRRSAGQQSGASAGGVLIEEI